MDWDSFFRLHDDLPREGPGLPEDVIWAAEVSGTKRNARILDAGAGPGGDVAALLTVAPEGRVHAVDNHAPFVDTIRQRFAGDTRVTAEAGDMMGQTGPFDLIWSAGAAYFMGIPEALQGWRPVLSNTGAVAFSHPCLFGEAPQAAIDLLFEGITPETEAQISAVVSDAGYEVLGTRKIDDSAWEAYYGPMETRIAALRKEDNTALNAVLDEAETEIATWRKNRAQIGYLLCVARPV